MEQLWGVSKRLRFGRDVVVRVRTEEDVDVLERWIPALGGPFPRGPDM